MGCNKLQGPMIPSCSHKKDKNGGLVVVDVVFELLQCDARDRISINITTGHEHRRDISYTRINTDTFMGRPYRRPQKDARTSCSPCQ